MQKKVTKKSPEDLITDFLKGELTTDEKNQLLDWIKSDEANKRLFDEWTAHGYTVSILFFQCLRHFCHPSKTAHNE